MKNKEYMRMVRNHMGPSGLDCPCCTDFERSKQKEQDRRRVRRQLKRKLDRREHDDEE